MLDLAGYRRSGGGGRHRALRALRTVLVIFAWYCISASIIIATKWLMSEQTESTRLFPYPLTITAFSNTAVTLWAAAFARLPRFKPQPLTHEQFRQYVLPIGVTTAMEIGFSNVALLLLTVSFSTILKGSSPVATMAWGVLLRVEPLSIPTTLAVLVIAGGITLASLGEGADFVLLGFLLQLFAVVLGGLRWAMTHLLLKGAHEPMPPLTATLYTSPTTAVCVLPFALALEGRAVHATLVSMTRGDIIRLVGLLGVIATLVFALLISEYWLVHDTSSLALSVAGVFKECLTIGAGLLLFHEHMSPLNITGFVVCQVGIAAYVALRYDDSQPDAATIGADAAMVQPLTTAFSTNDDDDVDDDSGWKAARSIDFQATDSWHSPGSPLVVPAGGSGVYGV
jgi:solute carrier family 35, member C2